MRMILTCLLAVGLLVPSAFAQCGPWGCPPQPPPTRIVEKEKSKNRTVTRTPTRAWRYEHAVGHRAAVVRIECWDTARVRSLGSGVLVRWGKRIVILTARHVIQDAKHSIYAIFHNGKKVKVKVLKHDVRWDCAVLNISDPPEGIEPAEMAFGKEAEFQDGDRLETAGYAPMCGRDGCDGSFSMPKKDGEIPQCVKCGKPIDHRYITLELASNNGIFQGYRGSTKTPAGGPDDWMVVSGHARQGDSGGPVFDSRGRVVGVLWGTDGRTVVCVQPGRLHLLLREIEAEQLALRERRPTPPMEAPLAPVDQARGADKQPLLPWRQDAEASQAAQDARIEALIGLMERQQQQKPPPAVDVYVGPTQPVVPPKPDGSPLWLWGSLGLLAAIGIFYGVQKN